MAMVCLLQSLFAGVLIIATIKEEVPDGRDVRFAPFLAGVAGYSVLLFLIRLSTPS